MFTKLQNVPPILYFTNNTDFPWPKLVNKLVGGSASPSASTDHYQLELVLCRETGALERKWS